MRLPSREKRAGRSKGRGGPVWAQWLAAGLVGSAVVGLAIAGKWPFSADPKDVSEYKDPSLWQFLLSDGTTLGFVRLGLAVAALYAVVSVPALIVGNRWLKGFGTSGIEADDASDASESIEDLQEKVTSLTSQLDDVTRERDEARDLARRLFRELKGKNG